MQLRLLQLLHQDQKQDLSAGLDERDIKIDMKMKVRF